jgi:hypothetical protein
VGSSLMGTNQFNDLFDEEHNENIVLYLIGYHISIFSSLCIYLSRWFKEEGKRGAGGWNAMVGLSL